MTYKPLLIMERAGLYLTVFLTGAAVMVIELLGTRLSLASITVGGEAAYSLRRTRLSESPTTRMHESWDEDEI